MLIEIDLVSTYKEITKEAPDKIKITGPKSIWMSLLFRVLRQEGKKKHAGI